MMNDMFCAICWRYLCKTGRNNSARIEDPGSAGGLVGEVLPLLLGSLSAPGFDFDLEKERNPLPVIALRCSYSAVV
jgi:hypothetical protein